MQNSPLSFKTRGFTLVEMMIVVVIAAILAAVAIPAYQEYGRRSNAAQAQQELQRFAILLDRWKARNFNYAGFATIPSKVASASQYPYTITIVDLSANSSGSVKLTDTSAVGRSWAMKATTNDSKNYNFLLTSTGVRCKNKTPNNVSYTTCGVGSENW